MFKCSQCKATFQSAIKFKKHGRNPCNINQSPLLNIDLHQPPTFTQESQQVPHEFNPEDCCNTIPQDLQSKILYILVLNILLCFTVFVDNTDIHVNTESDKLFEPGKN